MEQFTCEIAGRKFTIQNPIDESGYYAISKDESPIGYLYVSQLNEDLGRPDWASTTDQVAHYAGKLGDFIEQFHI